MVNRREKILSTPHKWEKESKAIDMLAGYSNNADVLFLGENTKHKRALSKIYSDSTIYQSCLKGQDLCQ